MAECSKYLELISAYVDNELSGDKKKELEQHLEGCAACRSILSAYLGINEAAHEAMAEPPESLATGVMDRLRQLPAEPHAAVSKLKHKSTLKPVIISFIAAAACLALVFVAAPQLLRSGIRQDVAGSAASVNEAASEENALFSEKAQADSAGSDMAADNAGQSSLSGQSADAVPKLATSSKDAESSSGLTAAQPTSSDTTSKIAGSEDTSKYCAVIWIDGQLPDILQNYQMTETDDGTFRIEVSAEEAKTLMAAGSYVFVNGSEDALTALVIYTPAG